jgi:glyoxylase-like metal-dependent hydrolase (beta-lactamase superfamily II)
MRQFGLTAEQAAGGSPDVAWLLAGEAGEGHFFSAGDRLPGVVAFPGEKHNDLVLWVEDSRAVLAGDTLVDFGNGFEINPRWLSEDVTREQVAEGLRPLLALPVEQVLATHGGRPTGPRSNARSPDSRPHQAPATGGSRWQRIWLDFAVCKAGRFAADYRALKPRGFVKAPPQVRVSRAVIPPAARRSGSRCGRSRCRAPRLAGPRVGSGGSSSARRGGSRP